MNGSRSVRPGISQHPGPVVSTIVLFGFLLLVFAVAAAGSWITQPGLEPWYAGLQKPPLTPANWVFPIVWPVLYLLMAFAGWLVWRTAGGFNAAGAPLSVFGVQLGFNLSWSVIFFGMHNPSAAAA